MDDLLRGLWPILSEIGYVSCKGNKGEALDEYIGPGWSDDGSMVRMDGNWSENSDEFRKKYKSSSALISHLKVMQLTFIVYILKSFFLIIGI